MGDFNTIFTSMDRSFRQKINMETAALNHTTDQMNLIDACRTFHPKSAKYTFFLRVHGTFSRTDHMSGHKKSLNKFKMEIISSIFSEHNGMKPEINYKKTGKTPCTHMQAKQHVVIQAMDQ